MRYQKSCTFELLETRVLMSAATEDRFQLTAGQSSSANSLAELHDSLFAPGYATSGSLQHGIIRQRNTQAGTAAGWTTVVDYVYRRGNTQFHNLIADPSRNVLFAVGGAIDSAGNGHWIVVECVPPATPSGAWLTRLIDDYEPFGRPQASQSTAIGAVEDARGDLFVSGQAIIDPNLPPVWVLRELNTDALQGATVSPSQWETRTFVYQTGQYSTGGNLAMAPAVYSAGGAFDHQDLFAVGSSYAGAEHTSRWLTYRGRIASDGQVAWMAQPEDDYQEPPQGAPLSSSAAGGVAVYDNGSGYDVYVTGEDYADNGLSGTAEGSTDIWIVRQGAYQYDGTPARTPTWQEVDRFERSGSPESQSAAVTTRGSGPDGAVYVAGEAFGTPGYEIVRKSDPTGHNWKTIDDAPIDGTHVFTTSILVAPSLGVYTSGFTFDGNNTFRWFVRRVASPLPGDANGDGLVNFKDLLVLAQHYGSHTATWEQGDFNGDGAVDFSDLLILSQNYRASDATVASRRRIRTHR